MAVILGGHSGPLATGTEPVPHLSILLSPGLHCTVQPVGSSQDHSLGTKSGPGAPRPA